MERKCMACGQMVDDQKPAGWDGMHRYGCIGPSTWTGMLDGWFNSHPCWCGTKAVIRINRNLMDFWACCVEHARKRRVAQTRSVNPFTPFVLACYRKM